MEDDYKYPDHEDFDDEWDPDSLEPYGRPLDFCNEYAS